MKNAHDEHIETLRKQLLDAILDENKSKMERGVFFEKLVVELILKLGYGADKDSGFTTSATRDGGIDGVIHEDKLGLDKIYIQAKCNTSDNIVTAPDIRDFVGAMEEVHKGIFVTSSQFSKDAYDYAEKGKHSKFIKLIDGEALTGLMVKHSVGLKEVKLLSICKLDSEYFER
jgi:restriction system protein